MSLRNPIQDFEFSTPQGLDTTSPLATMKDGFVREARNVNLGLSGGYTKRDGYVNNLTGTVYQNGSGTPMDITAGIEYRESGTATRKTVVFGTDGSGGRYGYISGGAVTNISTGLSGTVRPSFVQFDNLLFFYNGLNTPELYDGTSVRQVGITAPSGTLAGAGAAGGSLVASSNYIYAYTYYNSVTGAESSPKLSATIATGGGQGTINLTFSAGSSTTADTIRLYRTVANGNTLFLHTVAALTISATAYSDTSADSTLGRQIELDNTRIVDLTTTSTVPEALYPIVADNRVFVKTATNEIRFSKIGQEGPMPESFELKSFVPTVGKLGSNDDILGINRINQLPIVLKESSVGRLDPFGLPDFTNAVDNVGYTYREISDAVGAVAHEASCQVFNELVFLGRDNIYATNGLEVRPIANAIQASIRALGFISATQKPRLSAINDVEKRRIYITAFLTQASVDPDIVLVGDYQLYPNFRWTSYEAGTDSTTHPGVKAGCFFHVTNPSTGKLDVWFGNVVANGKVYTLGSGTNDDTKGIYMRLITRPYMGQNPLLEKLFKKAELQAQGSGNDYNVQICSIYNLSGIEEDCVSLSLFANGAVYDDILSIYDAVSYADETLKTLEYYMHRKAKYYQMSVKQIDADKPVSLFAWGVYSSGFGPNEGPKKDD